MQRQNIEEYKLIRGEMVNVKDCITKYIGFVFGGAGAIIYGLSRADHSHAMTSSDIVVLLLSISVIISIVLAMLFYKFNSHNRFAGFCKLLNHERFVSSAAGGTAGSAAGGVAGGGGDAGRETPVGKAAGSEPIFSWEVNVGLLRDLDDEAIGREELMEKLNFNQEIKKDLDKKLEQFAGRKPSSNARKYAKGFGIIMQTVCGRSKSRSWGFPPLVVTMFSTLIAGFMAASYYLAWTEYDAGRDISLLSGLIALVTIVQLLMWLVFLGKLHSLMNGSSTVNAFYWKFMPIRARFLKEQHDIVANYIFLEITKTTRFS